MPYELDISSETSKTASDLIAGQAMIVIDAVTNTAKLIVKDSAGDAFDVEFALLGALVKATGAEVDTGTNDTKFVTPKAVEDSLYVKLAAIPVKASGAEVDTGTDDAKFVTAKAIEDSTYGKVIAPTVFIADPAGGATSDTEARAAIVAILDLLIAREYMAAA